MTFAGAPAASLLAMEEERACVVQSFSLGGMQRFEDPIYTHNLLHACKRRISIHRLLKEECLAGKVIFAGGAGGRCLVPRAGPRLSRVQACASSMWQSKTHPWYK
jgi:hypothetical protein